VTAIASKEEEMKRTLAVVTTVIALLLPVAALASRWQVDPDHTHVGFKVRHLKISNVRGTFGKVKGVVDMDDKDITKSSVSATIEAASINTGSRKRDADLKGEKFLDVAKYPTITFLSTGISRDGADKLKVAGDLTIHGVTRPVALTVEGPTDEVKTQKGEVRRGAFARTRINRKDFGLAWTKAMEAGGVLVGDDVDIEIEVELVRVGGES
jgi:polyisoprenoid-binding protein YceI